MEATLKDFGLQTATRKADSLREKHPDSIIFVIYDYEAQKHDAITEDQLEDFYIMDWDFTIIYEL